MVAATLDVRRLVFVDECGTHTSLAPLYAWAPRGRRAYAKVPRNRGKNTTQLACMSAEGMGPCVAVEGTTTAEVFEAYVEQALAPTLKEGQCVVMDNLSAHKGEKVRQLVEAKGCRLIVPAAVLAGPELHRGGVLEGEGELEEGTGQKPRGDDRSHRSGNLRGHGPGCPRLLRTLWLPLAGTTAMMVAVSHCEAQKDTELS